ncbi:tetratricopeptide repeat protein [Marinobacter sp. ATCH36]|uniref:tetratricopeptide repeat protein n=1 Tax=Marinobacter sp. ATCH36 TaxID=2945106 RepID=UPI002020F929|nr:tetratricopeptide repeat protein [Marinobacter sp. ATCH36]MCL7944687.1 tetratricopeptide repeat protein [Marinobacter sp. ATCH36]
MNATKAIVLTTVLILTIPLNVLAHSDTGRVPSDTSRVPLFEGLGDHHHPITTDSGLAQRYFDQGLVLAFGFNHHEAHRSFLQAAELNPDAAMAWWGAAWVLGPNINSAMNPENAPKAWELLQKAEATASKASVREQAYINALAKRYGPTAMENRSSRDQAFAEAMGQVAADYPDDLDAQVIYAESLMNLTPWDYWQENGEPKAQTERLLKTLKSVLQRQPDHPHANHLLIHAVEAGDPGQGLDAAKRLEDLVPAAGHLVHMSAHIYIRVGHYHNATQANLRAIEADQRYLEQVDPQSAYRLGYVPHNYHFGWFTATLEGRSELAIRLAQEMAGMVDLDTMRLRPLTTLQHYWITPVYALVRFGKWDLILNLEEPAEDLVYPRAVYHYARGMAYTRQSKQQAARTELERLDELRTDPSLKWVTVWGINNSRHILEIASYSLAGEIAAADGHVEVAIDSLDRAVEREDALNYHEPPSWQYPTRQALGAILLQADQPERAEQIYRQDLREFPDNGWSLFGLMKALQRQGNVQEAREVQHRFFEAWQHADLVPTESRL